ncbi:flagellar biosynthesis protein FlhS [Bacillaceae bacterium SIJ1]|uniref:EscU/YscU/HrcU family type III secretion system export apparatus switch protein n=1 Tax=Litoribacterium kuwaitense TaxID=1398745 RepID=UPI0013EB4B67|nr:EscU/YscU/HrcU family type III secretion system export apparatus switch protein [Litoribacterium kuwaitense]NGP44934.1 flagellar biosynthesis protein FlhS [Litoribacterium kuwaitense]
MKYAYHHTKQMKDRRGPSAAVLKYDEQSGQSPKVVAQGHGRVAAELIELAKHNHIHLEENPGLLADLLAVDLGDQVPPQLYQVIAEVLLLIEDLEASQSNRGSFIRPTAREEMTIDE